MTTLYLRTSENNTLVDIEIMTKDCAVTDLQSCVIIDEYSRLLLNNLDYQDYLITRFESLSELRGWFFERYLAKVEDKEPTHKEIEDQIKHDYQELVRLFSLFWVID